MTKRKDAIHDLLKRSLVPLSVSDIITEIYGTTDNRKRRYVNTVLENLYKEGNIDFVGWSPRKAFLIPKRTPIYTEICEICKKDKLLSDLLNGVCPTCRDLMGHIDVPSTNGAQIISRAPKIDRGFGNHSDPETPIDPKKLSNHLKIVSMLVGKPVRIMISTTGKAIHGVLKDVYSDGFIGVQTQNGPATINTTKIVSMEEWFIRD